MSQINNNNNKNVNKSINLSVEKKKRSKDVEVHVCRFIDYVPSAICAADLHSNNVYCAIGRENGNIEIWDLNGSFIQRIIPGKGANTVRSLLWIKDNNNNNNNNNNNDKNLRLISCGLNGWLNEWNLESLNEHCKISCNGYAIWDIAQTQNNNNDILISASCDDGKLRIYRLSKNEFIFKCEFVTSARCLSTIWSKERGNNKEIVYGGTSNGLIFGFDIITRQQIINIVVTPPSVGGIRRKHNAIKPLIWSLCSLNNNNEIACSTSRGSIDIFDTKFATLIQSFNASKNDIYSLKYSDDNNNDILIAACIDGRVLQLTRKKNEFILTGYHRYHTHDVNVVSITNNKVISGGIDTQLISCSIKDFWTHYICSPLSNSICSNNIIKIANNVKWIKDILQEKNNKFNHKLNNKLFLYKLERTLQIWYITNNKYPIKLIDINVGFNIYNILSCSISNNGKWICVSNNKCIKLWKLNINKEKKNIKLNKIFETINRGSTTINFSNDNKYLFLTPNIYKENKNIDDYKINDDIMNIGAYLDGNMDKNCNIIRINLENQDKIKIDKIIKINKFKNYMISSLKLNYDNSLLSIIIPSLLMGVIIHIDFGKIFYEIPRDINNCNISCIEFQKKKKEKEEEEEELELLYVIYSNNNIKIFYYNYYLNKNKLFKSRNNICIHLWYSLNNKIWNSYNRNNPFSFTKIIFNPSTLNKALLLRSEYIFSLIINRKLPSYYDNNNNKNNNNNNNIYIGNKRTYSTMMKSSNNYNKENNQRIDELIPSPFGKPQSGLDKNNKINKNNKYKSSFLRVIRKYDPIICAQFIDNNCLLIVHAPWHKVSTTFKQPLYRKKYAI